MRTKILTDFVAGENLEATLRSLLDQATRGDFGCLAMRVYWVDGRFEDIAVGGDIEAKRQALEELKALYAQAH